jgi:ribosome-associated translation inhibitor RaiA
MQVHIHTNGVHQSDAIVKRATSEIEAALALFADQVTRVEVHLHDDNGPKAGIDKRCLMEIRLAGHQPLAVEHAAPDLYEAISATAGKAERAVRHKLERHEAKKSSH